MPDEINRADRLKRLKMRAWRRGMKEMDLILGGYVNRQGHTLSDAEIQTLETLMERPDQSLYAWISGAAQPPEDASAEEKAFVRKLLAIHE